MYATILLLKKMPVYAQPKSNKESLINVIDSYNLGQGVKLSLVLSFILIYSKL